MLHGLKALSKHGHRLLPSSCPTQITRGFITAKEFNKSLGSIGNPYDANHPVWTAEQLKNLKLPNLIGLLPPLRPDDIPNLKKLPTIRELAEIDREDNPWGKIPKKRNFFDTQQIPFPKVPETPRSAGNFISSVNFIDGTCKRFELNRTEALNALDLNFVAQIRKLYQQYDEDDTNTLTYMCHTSTPGTMFCAGTDWRAIIEAGRGSRYLREYFHGLYNLAGVIATTKKPNFSVMDGPVFGAGSAFMAGQMRATTESTVFAVPDVLIGYFPDCGILHKLAQLEETGRYIALTGRRLNFADMHFLNLANFHIGTSQDLSGAQMVIGQLQHDDHFRRMTMFHLAPIERPDDVSNLQSIAGLIRRVFKKKTIPLMMEELLKIRNEKEESQPGAKEWAIRTLKRMKKASPLSLVVTLEYMNMISRERFSFDDCLAMDFRLSQKFVETDDFWEGIKVATERNRSATWKYKTAEEVPDALVESFFRPFEDPRKELRFIESRKTDRIPDWVAYYDIYEEQVNIPLSRPIIMNKDGSMSISRLPPPERLLDDEQRNDRVSLQQILDPLEYWIGVTYRLDYALRHKDTKEEDLALYLRVFKRDIMGTCFALMRKFVMTTDDVTNIILDSCNDVMHSIQAVMLGGNIGDRSDAEFCMAARDVLPIIAANMAYLEQLLTPKDIPDDFQQELEETDLNMFDCGLVKDVDYL